MYTAQDITLYIPCYNVTATLPEVLQAVKRQTIKPACVLLIDDGSTEPLPASPGCEIIHHEKNRGLAAGRNTALQACKTSLLAALDADVVPDSDWLEQLLHKMNSEAYAGIGGRLDEKYQTLPDTWRATHMTQHWGDQDIVNPRFLYGANTLFKSDALRQVGGYDERYRTNDEDRTISDTLYAAGYACLYTPKGKCSHLRRDTLLSLLPGYWKWHYTRGLLQGDFDSPHPLVKPRMEFVNFGIFRYRYDTDNTAGRSQFLALDSCIPWVFCAQDLLFYAQQNNAPVPVFPDPVLMKSLNPDIAKVLKRILPEPLTQHSEQVAWQDEYYREFKRLLLDYEWYPLAHDQPDLWREFE